MVDIKLLEEAIVNSGKKKSYLAEKLGITVQNFRLKCTNISDFRIKEVNILCSELGITDLEIKEKIFFSM